MNHLISEYERNNVYDTRGMFMFGLASERDKKVTLKHFKGYCYDYREEYAAT